MLADIIKIHCLTHRANFPMPRTSRSVVCRESGEAHTLSSNFPNDGQWVYCCNCQTFMAWDKAQSGVSIKECPFCLSSMNPRVYACDRCAVTMVDFDDQTLRKHHAVLEWGAPQPACAGCHQFPQATPRKHFCQTLQIEVATGRGVCPFCEANADLAGEEPAKAVTARLDAALAVAVARTREAEERWRLAEETALKEIELRAQAERKAEETERRVTSRLNQAQASTFESEQAKRETETARATIEIETAMRAEAERLVRVAELERQEAERRKAEAEAKAREAEIKTREIEDRSRRLEEAARREAEMRAAAEQQTRETAERFTSQLAESQAQVAAVAKGVKQDRVAIALTTAIAVILFVTLIMLIITLIHSLR